MKFLKSYDDNFSACRSFLVCSMVITHVFEQFYIPDYNRNLTYFVTIGFVFLSGLAVGALYPERIQKSPWGSLKKLSERAIKLLILFAVCNFIVFLLLPHRLMGFVQDSILKIILSCFLGDNTNLFAFDILIPIAVSTFCSFFLLRVVGNRWNLAFLIFLFLLLVLTGKNEHILNYFGIKLLIIGLLGCLTGKELINLSWNRIVGNISSSHAIMSCAIVAIALNYLLISHFAPKGSPVIFHYQLIATFILLSSVYILSCYFQLPKTLLLRILDKTLAKHMLFAYLYHILVINCLFLIIRRDSLNFFLSSLLSFFLLSSTIALCYSIEIISKKSAIVSRIYSSIFKL